MKKKITIIITVILSILLITIIGLFLYQKWRVANAEIIAELQDNLNIEVFSKVKLSDLIKSINGEFIDDFEITTTKTGKKTIDFKYINDDNIKVSFSFDIDIVDKTSPLIFSSKSLTVTKGYNGDITKELFCGDNYDNTPKCEIVGDYDLNTTGSYPLTFIGKDLSDNVSKNAFTLIVKDKSSSSTPSNITTQNFTDIVTKYKTVNTKIGLDISRWQGDIDFKQVHDAGVEFVFIRVGSQRGINGEYIIDPKFEQNIKGFQEVGIPVGIYFYSYADSKKSAKEEAEWVVKQIKPYEIDLPVVFDWENWSSYQEFNKSFYNLTEIATSYLSTIEKLGYKGMLYSSKYYLENVWFETKYPVWLAHYTSQTNYQGNYKVWQLCNNGRVSGINGNVDINIMYN